MDEKKADEAEVVVLPDNPVRCALLKAADIVDERWMRGWGSYGGRTCALGAISEAIGGRDSGHGISSAWRNNPAGQKAAKLLAKMAGVGDPVYILHWNDRSVRGAAEVSAAMRKAAKLAD